VSSDACLNEIVLFELPSPWFAARLTEHVGSERFAWHLAEEDVGVVGVVLTPDELDLAHLLRTVQRWLVRQGLASIRFEVDRRIYVLESTPVASAAC